MSTQTLLIEGSFPELSEELAQYIDSVSEGADVSSAIAPFLETIRQAESQDTPNDASIKKARDEVLKKIVTKATVLNAAPERGKQVSLTLALSSGH